MPIAGEINGIIFGRLDASIWDGGVYKHKHMFCFLTYSSFYWKRVQRANISTLTFENFTKRKFLK